eukprot:gnl/TRDRNA2_/TRDRNA2_128875_c2_seq1.p1 gnl/TRDRNA2_/TRDRNA2_128875_c2~~gnl/TRDRNA2_/TRDRNA2_128875_c2_seq1.p1  ORF type:complete len:317 (-),score=42.75 gnl/TRDRNA2_/TRDRNA2_128875_c2_seq1:57-1007(-)
MGRLEQFAKLCARGRPTGAEVASYQQDVIGKDIVTFGHHGTHVFLRRFGLCCADNDPFSKEAAERIRAWRAEAASKDPTSRSVFHRAQCVWQLGIHGDVGGALADGIFESGQPTEGSHPDLHGLHVCRLRHPREGDAEVQALCAALGTSVLRGGRCPPGLALHLHLSEVPCVSCLGCTLQFHFRHPGVLRVSFDRGREAPKDSVPVPRPPPPPSKKGNALPYAPVPEFYANGAGAAPSNGDEVVDRSLLRKDGPDCREVTSFYGGSRLQRKNDGAALGGLEHVPHRKLRSASGSSNQTFYFSARPAFYQANDYEDN